MICGEVMQAKTRKLLNQAVRYHGPLSLQAVIGSVTRPQQHVIDSRHPYASVYSLILVNSYQLLGRPER